MSFARNVFLLFKPLYILEYVNSMDYLLTSLTKSFKLKHLSIIWKAFMSQMLGNYNPRPLRAFICFPCLTRTASLLPKYICVVSPVFCFIPCYFFLPSTSFFWVFLYVFLSLHPAQNNFHFLLKCICSNFLICHVFFTRLETRIVINKPYFCFADIFSPCLLFSS